MQEEFSSVRQPPFASSVSQAGLLGSDGRQPVMDAGSRADRSTMRRLALTGTVPALQFRRARYCHKMIGSM